jgi:hypothetical protein
MISLIKRIATCTEQTRASVPSACPRRTRLDSPSRCLSKGSRPSGKPQNRTVRQSSTVLLYERLASRAMPETCAPSPRGRGRDYRPKPGLRSSRYALAIAIMAIATYAVTTAHIAPKRMWKLMVIPHLLVVTRAPLRSLLVNSDQPSFVPRRASVSDTPLDADSGSG